MTSEAAGDREKAAVLALTEEVTSKGESAKRRYDSERWLAENLDALKSSNGFVEEHGLPLAHYRSF